MTVGTDPAEKLQRYAHPERLVTTDWLARHAEDPGLVKVDWHTDLQDPVARDYLGGEGFARLMSEKGIGRHDTIVFYGDNFNWWAAYALWVFRLFGHKDLRLLDGGRACWIAEGRPITTDATSATATHYPVVERSDEEIRAFRDDVYAHVRAGEPLVDVRSPEEYAGTKLHMPEYPQEGALRGGHIPGAASVPWKKAANEDGTFKSTDQLREIYEKEQGLSPDDDVIAYCRIGERSSHTWFVLTHLLGFGHVRNYDGSWTEWGNLVRAPIERPGLPVSPPV